MPKVVITPGKQVKQDPSSIKSYAMDWDLFNLASGASIATSTWRASAIRPNFLDDGLMLDSDDILNAAESSVALERTVTADNRVTSVRVSGGTLHQVYEVVNRIVTDETPYQQKEKSFRILVEQE